MAVVRVARKQHIFKSIKNISSEDLVFTRTPTRIIITINKKTLTDYEDREGLLEKLEGILKSDKIISVINDITNDNKFSKDLIYKQNITVDDVPETIKSEIRKSG